MTEDELEAAGRLIFWVEDFMSGKVLDNKHYLTRQEAAARRNELGYGIVKWHEIKDTCPVAGKCRGCG